jgi:hypothetical protein
MNVPFSPVWLWRLPISLMVGGILRRQWQGRDVRAGHGASPGARPRGRTRRPIAPHGVSRRVGVALWVGVLGVMLIGCGREVRVNIPRIEGRVVDARTGAPLAGAMVKRQFFQPGPQDLVDTRAPRGVEGSYLELVTDADGRFGLPAFSHIGPLTGMSWVIYKAGYMPGKGCYGGGYMEGGCSGLNAPSPAVYPWVERTFHQVEERIEMEVRMLPPTLEGVHLEAYDPLKRGSVPLTPKPGEIDPWGEYFKQLNLLVQDHYLDVEEFVKEAAGYVERHTLTEGVAAEVGSLLPSGPCDTPYCRDPRIRLVAQEVVEYCDRTPDSAYCQPRRLFLIERLRGWLHTEGAR